MEIPEGYVLTITARGGEVVLDIDLEGYDLSKSVARGSIMNEIQHDIECDIEQSE